MPGEDNFDPTSYGNLLEKLLAQLQRLPGFLRAKIEAQVMELLALVRDHRPPRFVLIGRRGAGKSTLLNAIFGSKVAEVGSVAAQTGKSEWRAYQGAGGRIVEILDTRGVQEGGRPAEHDDASTAEASVLDSIRARSPDALLFLCKAKEVDAAIHGDLDFCEQALRTSKIAHEMDLPVVGVVTQCDELDPPFVRKLPTDDEEKNKNINKAVEVLENYLTSRPSIKPLLSRVLPVIAYARFRLDGSIDEAHDYRWNINQLVQLLVDELPKEAKLDFARVARVRQFQRNFARSIVMLVSGACGLIGAEPIPLADLPILTSLQLTMVLAIAYVSGRDLSLEAAKEFFVAMGINCGAAFVFREIARGLAKLILGWGDFVSGAVAAKGTWAIGEAAIAYFIDHSDIDRAKSAMRSEKKSE
jgi:predicted GTPase